jgi:hypothetical protein
MNAESAPQGGDDRLVEVLRRALAEADEVPSEVLAAARAAWTWRTIDAELAALVHDSTLDDQELAGVRGAATVRALSFTVGEHFLELEVAEDGDRRSIVGQVMPAQAGLILEGADGRPPTELAVDALGRFSATRLAPGLVRLRAADGALVTEWVAI